MTTHQRDDSRATGRLSDEALARLRSRSVAESALLSLLLFTRDGVVTVALYSERPVTIGREPPATVRVRDSSLSRVHARLSVDGSEVLVEDLGSTNGTWLEGARVERATVRPGAELAFGSVPASVHLATGGGARAETDDHDSFMNQLARELARARHHGRSLAVVMARGSGGAKVSQWLPALRDGLRAFDTLALYSRETAEVLLPEVDAAGARAAMEQLAASASLRCGLALHPDHGGTAEALLEAALGALDQTGPGRSLAVAGKSAVHEEPRPDEPVVLSASMRWVFDTARRLADVPIPVLITGETGTGKEVVARAIHHGGKRRDRPMVCVNCGCIPAQLVESTLFGHERGAFTGAGAQRIGVFEAADGGTVLLDELGELPAGAQAALLRVLETGRFHRVGSTEEIEVDVRVIAATHRDLETMCQQGAFRWDLLYRLNVMILELPPLRQRPEEIEPLVQRFLRQARERGLAAVAGLEPQAARALQAYHWPGNVRELRNAVERAMVICGGEQIAVEDLPRKVRCLAEAEAPRPSTSPEPAAAGEDLKSTLQRWEAELILAALERAAWDRKAAAAALGLPLRTLAHKMKTLGIRRAGYERG